MVKNGALILVALFVDFLQVTISWGIWAVAAFPGNALGGVAGCAGGNAVAGEIGCWIGGGVLGVLGTFANPFIAPVTIPIGATIGIAINMVLSFVLGYGFLFFLLLFFGLKPYKRLWWSGAELIPGINNVPFWTMFTISCIWAQSSGTKARKGVLGIAGLALAPVRGIMNIKENTTGSANPNNIPQPTSARELIRASEKQYPERAPMRDIRPSNKSNVQVA
ncbi:MAG: hypothetical protein KBD50_03390 [Candidatus Pacebacteria bacterium]|nr:hypothetical protein [Candidatus Paceibacterota bacterium]